MFVFPQRIPVIVTYTDSSFAMAATSSAGLVALSNLPWCVLSMLCNTTHVETMSLTPLPFAPSCPVGP